MNILLQNYKRWVGKEVFIFLNFLFCKDEVHEAHSEIHKLKWSISLLSERILGSHSDEFEDDCLLGCNNT